MRRQVDWGRSKSLKREEKVKRKRLAMYTPSFSIFISMSGIGLPSCGRTFLGSGGGHMYVVEVEVFGAQDKDVRPDTEFSCQKCLQ